MCKEIISQWPDQRIIILSHVKELLEQNFNKIKAFWPDAPAGLYCVGLKQKRAQDAITVASIQSVYKKAHIFGWRDMVLIDESHLLSPDSATMYQVFIDGLKETNPRLKVVGFTATPFRLKTGMLHEGDGLFTDIASEITMRELIDAGHISRMIGKSSIIQADMSNVHKIGGEFDSEEMAAAQGKILAAALDEVFSLASDRKTWLLFCSGVKHAEHVRDAIRERNVSCETVTGETPAEERDALLTALKNGVLQAVTNVNVLTTGFDAPNIDLIVLLRSTTSPGLFLQMAGRGLRIAEGKENCLLLDYGGNLERHGCLDQIKPPRAAGRRSGTDDKHTPTCLICPDCRMANPLGALECWECGKDFTPPERVSHEARASDAPVMMSDVPEDGGWLMVENVKYYRHAKKDKTPSMRVEYHCDMAVYKEWICLEHSGFAREKAAQWWRRRTDIDAPGNVEFAVFMADCLRKPYGIQVERDDRYWRIKNYDFTGRSIPETPVADHVAIDDYIPF